MSDEYQLHFCEGVSVPGHVWSKSPFCLLTLASSFENTDKLNSLRDLERTNSSLALQQAVRPLWYPQVSISNVSQSGRVFPRLCPCQTEACNPEKSWQWSSYNFFTGLLYFYYLNVQSIQSCKFIFFTGEMISGCL